MDAPLTAPSNSAASATVPPMATRAITPFSLAPVARCRMTNINIDVKTTSSAKRCATDPAGSLPAREPARDHENERHRRIDVSRGQVADRVDQRGDHKSERHANVGVPDDPLRQIDDCNRAGPNEDQHEGPKTFSQTTPSEWMLVHRRPAPCRRVPSRDAPLNRADYMASSGTMPRPNLIVSARRDPTGDDRDRDPTCQTAIDRFPAGREAPVRMRITLLRATLWLRGTLQGVDRTGKATRADDRA
jgi:hypothetical protein